MLTYKIHILRHGLTQAILEGRTLAAAIRRAVSRAARSSVSWLPDANIRLYSAFTQVRCCVRAKRRK